MRIKNRFHDGFALSLGLEQRLGETRKGLATKTPVSPRSSPLGTLQEKEPPPRETSPAAKSEEKRMFSQARKELIVKGSISWWTCVAQNVFA